MLPDNESTEARLARIETKLDTIVQHLMDDHEKRIRAIEKWKATLPVAIVLALGSIAVAIVTRM